MRRIIETLAQFFLNGREQFASARSVSCECEIYTVFMCDVYVREHEEADVSHRINSINTISKFRALYTRN